jgi:nucleotide-binding universal stress UspA family protein
MAFPFKSILVPVDFDQSSLKALELAAKVARQNNGKVFVLHIVPVDIDVSDMPQYAELITHQEGLDREKLTPLAQQYLGEVPWEILDDMGQPADVIVNVAQRLPADLIVMVTHGRRGLARLVEGRHRRKSAPARSLPGPRCASRPVTCRRTPAPPRLRENRTRDRGCATHRAEGSLPLKSQFRVRLLRLPDFAHRSTLIAVK